MASGSYTESYKDLYHGTIQEFATSIISTQKFNPSKQGWCGSGVYFYDNKSKAWWSANRTYTEQRKLGKTSEPTVVVADINSICKSRILDLRAPFDLKNFADFVDDFLMQFDFDIQEELSPEELLKTKRAMLLSFYCEEKDIQLIIGYFKQQAQDKVDSHKEFVDAWQLAIGIETIYCAKEPKIICNIRDIRRR